MAGVRRRGGWVWRRRGTSCRSHIVEFRGSSGIAGGGRSGQGAREGEHGAAIPPAAQSDPAAWRASRDRYAHGRDARAGEAGHSEQLPGSGRPCRRNPINHRIAIARIAIASRNADNPGVVRHCWPSSGRIAALEGAALCSYPPPNSDLRRNFPTLLERQNPSRFPAHKRIPPDGDKSYRLLPFITAASQHISISGCATELRRLSRCHGAAIMIPKLRGDLGFASQRRDGASRIEIRPVGRRPGAGGAGAFARVRMAPIRPLQQRYCCASMPIPTALCSWLQCGACAQAQCRSVAAAFTDSGALSDRPRGVRRQRNRQGAGGIAHAGSPTPPPKEAREARTIRAPVPMRRNPALRRRH